MKKLVSFLLIGALVLCLGAAALAAEGQEAPEDGEEERTLSDDIYSFQLVLDGELYAFPMPFADFTAMGWEYDGDADAAVMAPYEYTVVERFTKGDLEIYATMANMGINTAPFSACSVVGISVDPYQFEDAPDTEIVFPGGLAYGAATAEDIQDAYGTPSDVYEGDLYTKLTYEYDYYRDWEFYIYKESGTLDEFEVTNIMPDEEANAAAAELVTDEPTEEVLAYEAPGELGDDPMSFVVEYAGDLYRLPAPVSAFLENGWTLKEVQSDAVVCGGDYGWVTLMKDNQELSASMQNYSPDAAAIVNCFVTSVESDDMGADLPLNLPGGIARDMTEGDLLSALEGMGYETDNDSDYFTYYKLQDPDGLWDYVKIRVSKETGTVTSIEVSHEPDELPLPEK